MKKILFVVILILLVAGSIFALTKKQKKINNNSRLQVTTSFYPMYFFASVIGGKKVQVTNITPAGAEPHDYEPTPQDITKIEMSKLLIMNGNVEPWANKIKENLNGKNVQTITAGQDLTTLQIKENGILAIDPHVWLSPKRAKIESQKIATALISIDPSNSAYYQSNLTGLENDLDKIDASYKTNLQNCTLRSFVTSHAAFGYLSTDYNLTQIAISGLSPDAEPSLADLAQTANFAKKNNVKVIFFEALVSPKLSETIASEVGAKTMVLDPIEGINNEDLSKGINYLTLMANNLQNLRIALQCK